MAKQQMNYANTDLITYAYSHTTRYHSKACDMQYPIGTNQHAKSFEISFVKCNLTILRALVKLAQFLVKMRPIL